MYIRRKLSIIEITSNSVTRSIESLMAEFEQAVTEHFEFECRHKTKSLAFLALDYGLFSTGIKKRQLN